MQVMSRCCRAVFLLIVAGVGAPAFAQSSGEVTFNRDCAACHSGALPEAPGLEAMRQLTPEGIVNVLTNGSMQTQGSALTEAERRAVAEFLSGRTMSASPVAAASNRCSASPPMANPASAPSWNGWGNGIENTRYQPASTGRLTAADVPKLKLEWAFGFAGIDAVRAQPAVAGGRVFVASENAEVHALDPRSGCTHWTFKAQSGIRTALTIAPYRTAGGNTAYAAYFGDARANAYAVDANTGNQIWVRKVHDHAAAAITGAPAVHDNRVFVPVQGLNEEGQGGRPQYECCTFRGSLSALDASTGDVLWTTYMVDEPRPRARNSQGVQQWGPAGGGIWAAPTVDARRGAVYVATGNGYADPPQPMNNAVVAMDVGTGRVLWVSQTTPNDQWTMGCKPENPDNPNCPAVMGPDYDFSASPSLVTVNGRDLLVLPQKSGLAYAMDPDRQGEIVWQYRIGQGSGFGGQWGGAVDPELGLAYFGVADLFSPNPGGIHAVRLATGERVWHMPPQPPLCGEDRSCRASQGAAVTAIPGAVFSGSLDGGMRVYSAKDGTIIWQFDTNREFDTVNGVKARGGGLEGPGAIVVDGMVYFNSGYGGILARPGNVLLAFGID